MEENWLNDEYVRYYNTNYATPSQEYAPYLELLELGPQDALLDLGCGAGEFLTYAAPRVARVHGIDLSPLQISLASEKCSALATPWELTCTSFEKFQAPAQSFTKGFSRKALHHLADPQKLELCLNLGPAFRSGALLYIEDGIFFNFERSQLDDHWEELWADAARYYGESWESKRQDLYNSFRREHPCGLGYWKECLQRGGFQLLKTYPRSSFYGGILARKV